MKKKFRLQAYTSEDRHFTIDKIQKMIANYRGFLVNYKMFSDLQMNMYIEMKEYRLLNFYHKLRRRMQLDELDLDNYDPHSRKTCRVFLNVTFLQGSGRMKVKIPKVPG